MAATPEASMRDVVVVGVLIVWLAGYGIACWIWPFANCPRCHGTGKRRSPSGRAFRLCRRCDATGRRLRLGRRLWNWHQR
jgi:hypothetical protein